eukprot:3910272-Amphidinium_carterae.1
MMTTEWTCSHGRSCLLHKMITKSDIIMKDVETAYWKPPKLFAEILSLSMLGRSDVELARCV